MAGDVKRGGKYCGICPLFDQESDMQEKVMHKNDTAVVKITDIGVNGEGIGKVDGYTLFIKDAVIGDTVEAKVMKA